MSGSVIVRLLNDFLKQQELFNGTISGMRNQLQRHWLIALGAKQGVFAKAVEEPLSKRFRWQHSVASWVIGPSCRYNIGQLFSDLLVTYISMQSVVTDSVKSFWQNVLNHPSDEFEDRECFVFNLSCFMVSVPVADRFSVIAFNSFYGNRRRDNILGQVLSQSLSPWRNFAWLEESDKAFGIVFPGPVNIFFDGGVGNLLPEHIQEMILPFSVHHLIRNIRDTFPLLLWINTSGGHEDMQVWVVMAGSSCGLKNDNVSDVEFCAGAGLETIFETGVACPHEVAQQCGIAIKPLMEEIRHCQHDVPITDSGQQTSADEVCPSVGIDFSAGKAEAGFAGKCDTSYFAAVAAAVLYKAHFFRIAAIKHFLDGVIVIRAIKSWLSLLKRIPVIVENLLESVFVDAFHGCSLRTTLPKLAE